MNTWIQKIEQQLQTDDDFMSYLRLIDIMKPEMLVFLGKIGMHKEYGQAFLLKIENLLVGRFQYKKRNSFLLARPYALIVDPANLCPLHCPGCLHNRTFQKKIRPDWPSGIMSMDRFEDFLKLYGPYATSLQLFNWGEPLLNKDTPAFIQLAKKFLLHTSVSSNLSVHFDAEALVRSGLDYMIMSVDGTDRESYQKYRKGGNFDLVIQNMRALVNAKKKFNSKTPLLSWQFLLFEHTSHQVAEAKKMAEDIGVNNINFCVPYNVSWDIETAAAKNAEQETHLISRPNLPKDYCLQMTDSIAPEIGEAFTMSWLEQLKEVDAGKFKKRKGKTCQWLYSTLAMDAAGRYLPCCYAPRKESGFSWVFGNDSSSPDPFNSDLYSYSRQHFVWPSELQDVDGGVPSLKNGQCAPYCTACPDSQGKPLVNEEQLKRYLKNMDYMDVLDEYSLDILSDWNK